MAPRPYRGSSISSGRPPSRLATTAVPAAIASATTRPKPSWRDASTNRSAAFMISGTSVRGPAKVRRLRSLECSTSSRICAAHDGEADLGNGRRDTLAGAHERVHVLAGVDAADGYDQGLLRPGTQAAAHALGAEGGSKGSDVYRVIEDLDLGVM